MGPAPDPITGALLALRLLAVADAPDVAERSGWPQPDIDRVLAHLDESGWARYRPGRFPGWMLTGHGRAEGERRQIERALQCRLPRAAQRPRCHALRPHGELLPFAGADNHFKLGAHQAEIVVQTRSQWQ